MYHKQIIQLQHMYQGAGHAETFWKQILEVVNVIHHNHTCTPLKYARRRCKVVSDQCAIEEKMSGVYNKPNAKIT